MSQNEKENDVEKSIPSHPRYYVIEIKFMVSRLNIDAQ